jgi:hypothetical protein
MCSFKHHDMETQNVFLSSAFDGGKNLASLLGRSVGFR